ncbi:MAG TPA: hypothetical protein VIJ25_11045, partial [Methylococcales bacterium]
MSPLQTKRIVLLMSCTAALFLAGCCKPQNCPLKNNARTGQSNMWVVGSVEQLKEAVVRLK